VTSAHVSVVVPTRDRPSPLARLIDSLAPNETIDEIIVVDDGSCSPVRAASPHVRVIRLQERSMVSAARNRGAAVATGDVLMFIDDDCVAAPGAIDRLAWTITRDPHAGIVGPTLAYLSSPEVVWCAGVARTKWLSRTRFVAQGMTTLSLRGARRRVDIDFPSAFAIRRTDFLEVGGFDELGFPMHMEEADLAARVRQKGLGVCLVPDALVWHDIPAGAPLARALHLTDPERAFLAGRSRERYLRRHVRGVARAMSVAYWLVVLAPAYVFAILTERDRPLPWRLAVARSFVWGVFAGLVGRWR
jgi:GT2 family glycosyltransferase